MTTRATPVEKTTGTLITDTIYNGQIIQNLLYVLGFVLVGDLKPAIRSADYGLTWLVCDNRTIGSSASGANIADDLMETLFKHLWDTIDSTKLFILTSGGSGSTKGASAAADWTANKRIGLPDMRGMMPLGIDGSRGNVTDAAADLMGGTGGLARVSLVSTELPTNALFFSGSGGIYAAPAAGTVIKANTVTSHENMPPYLAVNWMIFTGVTYE